MTLVRPEEFTCRTTVNGGRAVVAVTGELDMSTAPTLSDSLAEVLESHPQALTVDLAGVEFIDSSGLTLLVRASTRMKAHDGALTLTSPTTSVRRVLEIVGLDGLLGS